MPEYAISFLGFQKLYKKKKKFVKFRIIKSEHKQQQTNVTLNSDSEANRAKYPS